MRSVISIAVAGAYRQRDALPYAGRIAGHVDAGATIAVPASGRSSVASTRINVVLPAPFGRSRPSTYAAGRRQ